MKQIRTRLLVVLALCAALPPAFAQPVAGPTPQQLLQEQRRAEMRSALVKAQGRAEPANTGSGLRQLSPQERVQLREQLRQQDHPAPRR
ncbi:MAG: hypothetical protein V4562_12810 [Pseudomonadota bacterium]